MPLWTDLFEPAELTGFARAALDAYEESLGSLEQFLPNETVDDTHVEYGVAYNGLIEIAEFRAFDAEPSIGRDYQGKTVRIELPAIGQKRLMSEYRQLRLRNATDDSYRQAILKGLNNSVRAIADRMELLRGVVIDSGKATVDQSNYHFSDDFGRPAGNSVVAAALWSSAASVDRIADLLNWRDAYRATNYGVDPGVILMSLNTYNVMRKGSQFFNSLTGRQYTFQEINQVLADQQLPAIQLYDRQVNTRSGMQRVLPNNCLYYLPAEDTARSMGATFWGTTLASTELDWGIADDERAGIVAGVVKTENVPVRAEIVADAIGMPVLGNAALNFKAQVS